MQRLEVSGAVQLIYGSLGAKGLNLCGLLTFPLVGITRDIENYRIFR